MSEKKSYAVADGVTWVNGALVPKSRKVELTATEAAFDLGYARITLDTGDAGVSKPSTSAPAKAQRKKSAATVQPQRQAPAIDPAPLTVPISGDNASIVPESNRLFALPSDPPAV